MLVCLGFERGTSGEVAWKVELYPLSQKYHWAADLLFDCFGFGQISLSLTKHKQSS